MKRIRNLFPWPGCVRLPIALLLALLLWQAAGAQPMDVQRADLIIVGGSPAGIMTAVAAARMGHSSIIIEHQPRIGGMISGGLCKTDIGKRETVGGLSAEYFRRILAHYESVYGRDSRQYQDARFGELPEPRVAEKVFDALVAEHPEIRVLTRHRFVDIVTDGPRVQAILAKPLGSITPTRFEGRVFIDASYEADFMARAGIPYRVGRESRAEYGESFAGINAGPEQALGKGDHKLQAYNIRGTITNNPDLVVPFPRPVHYHPERWKAYKGAVLIRGAKTLDEVIGTVEMSRLANDKFDMNIADLPGVNYTYPEADWDERHRIYEKVRDNWLSVFHMLQNDPGLPQSFLEYMKGWGLPRDEYPENGHITPQMYIRESRRMIGLHVLTQHDLRVNRYKRDGICLGSYNMDSHVVDHVMTAGGKVAEGYLVELLHPYEIPYGVIVPPVIPNMLVVGNGISATHVAFGSARMEPVFMMLGHAAGVASHLAMTHDLAVQEVDTGRLRAILRDQGALLDAPYLPVVGIRATPAHPKPGEPVRFELVEVDVREPLTQVWWSLDGSGKVHATGRSTSHVYAVEKVHEVSLLVQDRNRLRSDFVRLEVPVGAAAIGDVTVTAQQAAKTGGWHRARAQRYDFRLLFTDRGEGKGERSARFEPVLPRPGRYQVSIAYPHGAIRPDQVPVTVKHAEGVSEFTLNQQRADTPFVFKPFGEFRFEAGTGGWVEIRNDSSEGQVAIDAVRWIWLGD